MGYNPPFPFPSQELDGKPATGEQLVALLGHLVTALNEKEIPNAGSIVESFNRQLIGRALEKYTGLMEALGLPMDQAELQEVGGWIDGWVWKVGMTQAETLLTHTALSSPTHSPPPRCCCCCFLDHCPSSMSGRCNF